MNGGLRVRWIPMATVLALLLGMGGPAFAIYGKKATEREEVEGKPIRLTFHDRTLVDQDGRKVKFPADVIGDRIVVIDTFYTTCTQICPILSATFLEVQEQLGSRQGREVVLVSFTVDPVTDIPPRLKEYADSWSARTGWLFLGGEKGSVDQVLKGLGLYTANFVDHPPSYLVGDGKTGQWTRFYGFATPEQIVAKIEELAAARRTRRK